MGSDPQAYENNWYRQLKAWSARDDREDDADDDAEPLPDEQLLKAADLSTIAAIEALEAICEIGGPGAVDALVGCLADPEPRVRVRALQLLGEIGDVRAVYPIKTSCLEDSVPQVATAARMALAKIGETA